jgi:xanthine dehydrogenase accessory factor
VVKCAILLLAMGLAPLESGVGSCHDRNALYNHSAHGQQTGACTPRLAIDIGRCVSLSKTVHRLLPLFEELRAQSSAMVWAVVTKTAGPTYAKAGAQMLIAPDGRYAGLLSGGCLEGDLAEHARGVLVSGLARLVTYDMRTPDDLLFGLGSGCEGAMDILLVRLDAARDWQPLSRLAAAWRGRHSEEALLVVTSRNANLPAGAGVFPRDGRMFGDAPAVADIGTVSEAAERSLPEHLTELLAGPLPDVEVLRLSQAPPPQILVLGAGPDAQPVVALATQLGWSVTVIDHRSHYARIENFPGASAVLDGGPAVTDRMLGGAARIAAAVVMSHHFSSDLAYLGMLAHSDVPYIGLLGPAVRRERLLFQLGAESDRLAGRLRAPVGLNLGADTPESIALAIVAEIHAVLAGRDDTGSMSDRIS